MPRSRATEVPQRQSPRGPPNLRTSSSDSDPLHHRPRTEKSPKLSEGRSPRGAQSDPPVTQKKLGTRIADLESQLGQAQEELKSLKDQLASAEAAKKAAQDQLEKKPKRQQNVPVPQEIQQKHSTPPIESQTLHNESRSIVLEASDDVQQETDVFEVTIEKVKMESETQLKLPVDQGEHKNKTISLSTESTAKLELENPLCNELSLKNDEITSLKKMLEDKDKELEVFQQENERLKGQVEEKSINLSSAQSKIVELTAIFNKVREELVQSRSDALHINDKLEATEKAKEELENEMKRLRVQTDQWRKAADAAASVLAGGAGRGVEMSGRRISERCGSMDKHHGNGFEPVGGYAGYVGSPGLIDDTYDLFGGGKRKGSGIRMFGDLWKKKGQK